MIYPKDILDQIGASLISRKQTVSVAESVTSGHLQAAFSSATDAGCFFQGGITAYNLGQKCKQLLVEPIHALACDCVSETVAAQMAIQVRRMFLSDYGIAVTGYATPVPEKGLTKLYAWVCIVQGEELVLSKKINPGETKAFDAQLAFTVQILQGFNGLLK